MSQTQRDEYLYSAACAPPEQAIVLDPNFGNVRLVTPIGRMSYVTIDRPRAQPGQEAKFSLSLLLAPDHCAQLWQAICLVADKRWPAEQKPNPSNPSEIVTMNGSQMLQYLTKERGGLANPLKQGNDMYTKDPSKYGAYRDLMVLNPSVKATDKNGKSQQPFVMDEDGADMPAEKLYSGCYGRCQITVFAYPQPGQAIPNRGVGVILNSVQFARHGEKMGGFDAKAAAQAAFGALPRSAPAPMTGTTGGGNPWTNPAGPGAFAAPTGGALPFATPPAA